VRPVPFVGREQQLQVLEAELERAQGLGRAAVVVGEAGIGKSRLLNEFARRNSRRVTVLTARGSPVSTAIPFSVFAEAFESHLRRLDPVEVTALGGRRLVDLKELLPSVDLALETTDRPVPSRLRILEAARSLLEALAVERPVILAIDDLHQADPSSWECLNYLVRNPPAARVLLVAAVRSEELFGNPQLAGLVATLLKDDLAAEVRLAPIDRVQVAALTRRLLPTADAGLAEWLFFRARGNLLYTIALLEELSIDPSRRVVPVSVQERVRIALLELTEASRRVIEAASVIGHAFSLASILAMFPAASADDIHLLVRRSLIAEDKRGRAPGYDFAHPLVQEAIYAGLGPARRRELHQLAARTLVSEPIGVRAYHVGLGALPGDIEAVVLLRQAARAAEQGQAHHESIAHLTKALELLPAGDAVERAEVLDEIAWQASAAGDHRSGISALEALLPLVRDDALESGRTHVRLASFLATGVGDLPGAERHVATAVQLLSDDGGHRLLPAALNESAWIHGEGGDLDRQIAESLEAARLARLTGQEEVLVHALGCAGHALALEGRTGEAVPLLEESLALARASGDRGQVGWHTGALGEALLCAGRIGEAAELLDGLLEAEPNPSDVAYFSRARVNWFRGRWDLVLSDARMVQALNPTALSMHSAWTLSLGGLVLTGMGLRDEAAALLSQAERIYAGRDFYCFSAWHDWASGCAAWLSGDLERAQERLERSVARLELIGARAAVAQILPDLVQFERAAGGESLAQLWERRAQELGGSAAKWSEIPVRRARQLELEAVSGNIANRDEKLAAAARLYASLPMPVEEQRVLALLRTTGIEGRRAARGAGSLSSRELTVARLAAAGSTTREIGTKLGIGERTVETHLAHIYAKLGVEGRQELAFHRLAGQRRPISS
jgi:DNA-binding CsgD family transcriptional regulator